MADMYSGTNSGCKQLLVRRMFMAIASSIVVQFFFMSCVILITNLSFMHPLSWIQDTWSIVTRLRMWCYFIVLAAVILLQGIICSKTYLNAPTYLRSRFAAFCAMFTPHNLLVGILYVTIGLVLVWLHLSLEDGEYSSLTKPCESTGGSCLVEEHYYLLLGGAWTGIYYFAKTNFFGLRYLQFPIIPQSKFNQVKRGISSVLPSAMTSAVWPTLYLMGVYYFLGSCFRGFVVKTLFLNAEGEPLDGISRLLNPSLIFHSWLYAALFVVTMNSMHLLFQAYLTEWMSFEIGQKAVFNNENPTATLPEALDMDKVPIVQHLGYLDLITMAQKDKSRRSVLFTLSQPGGHPYNWNCVVEKCLALVKNFAMEINDVCSAKRGTRVTTPNTTADVIEKTYAYHMRNLVAAQTEAPSSPNINTRQDASTEQSIAGYFQNKKNNFVSYVLSKPLIFYFFGKQSDNEIRHVLMNGQTIIWAADAVSTLSVVSLKEDPYGIVQKDLPSIIETLLTLKQCLDKLQKTNMLMRKPQNDDKTIRQMLTSLRTASKRSIYRIVYNFRDYLDDLALEPTVRDQLQSFLSYRE